MKACKRMHVCKYKMYVVKVLGINTRAHVKTKITVSLFVRGLHDYFKFNLQYCN